MRVAISGSHGLIGRHLVPELERAGHTVLRLVRCGAGGHGDVFWDPRQGVLDGASLRGVEAAIHLAGEPVAGRRWNEEHKRRLLDSREKSTQLLTSRLTELSPAPSLLVSASAVGYYGDRGDERLTEGSPGGSGFLADLCRRWEAAAQPAAEAGIRTVFLRTGIVQAPDGGVLKPLLVPFKLGLGAVVGSGQQWNSWISIDDEVSAIKFALDTDGLAGPLNLTAPTPVTNSDYTRTLARVLRRPAVMRLPAAGLRAVLGREMAEEILLSSQQALPLALEESGFVFRHPELAPALRALLQR